MAFFPVSAETVHRPPRTGPFEKQTVGSDTAGDTTYIASCFEYTARGPGFMKADLCFVAKTCFERCHNTIMTVCPIGPQVVFSPSPEAPNSTELLLLCIRIYTEFLVCRCCSACVLINETRVRHAEKTRALHIGFVGSDLFCIPNSSRLH